MLPSTQTLPRRPQRILVAGISGVGKSTLGRRIADATGSPYTEIDGLFHGPDWTPRPSFEADVDAFTRASAWVTEWQYSPVRAMLAARADTIVVLDLAASVALSRVVRRTIRRSRTNPDHRGRLPAPPGRAAQVAARGRGVAQRSAGGVSEGSSRSSHGISFSSSSTGSVGGRSNGPGAGRKPAMPLRPVVPLPIELRSLSKKLTTLAHR